MRGAGAPQVAVRRVEHRCHHRQPPRVRRHPRTHTRVTGAVTWHGARVLSPFLCDIFLIYFSKFSKVWPDKTIELHKVLAASKMTPNI